MGLALFDLLASGEVTYETLKNADEQGLIRLEKRLKAAQKLNEKFPQELVVQAIDALRTRKKALLYLLSEPTIRALNQGETKYLFNAKIQFPSGNELGPVKDLFVTLLEADLREFLVLKMREYDWEAVYNWLKLKPVLSTDLIRVLQSKLRDLLEEMFQSIRDHKWHSEERKKYGFISNTTFYHVLNQLDGTELLALISKYFDDSTDYYTRGINLQEYTHFFEKLSIYRPHDTAFQQNRKAVQTLSFLKELDYKPNQGSGGPTFKTIGMVLFMLFSLVRLAKSCDSLNSNPKSFNDKTVLEIERQIKESKMIAYKMYTEFGAIQQMLGSRNSFGTCDSVYTDQGLSMLRPSLTSMTVETGQILKGDLKINGGNSKRQPVVFFNHTKQDMVVYLIIKSDLDEFYSDQTYSIAGMSKGAVVIKSGDSLQINAGILKFFIHSGKKLYGYAFNSEGKSQAPFNWAFCPLSRQDSALVNHSFEFSQDTKELGGKLELSQNKSGYKIRWTGAENTLYNKRLKAYLPNDSFYVIDLKKGSKSKHP